MAGQERPAPPSRRARAAVVAAVAAVLLALPGIATAATDEPAERDEGDERATAARYDDRPPGHATAGERPPEHAASGETPPDHAASGETPPDHAAAQEAPSQHADQTDAGATAPSRTSEADATRTGGGGATASPPAHGRTAPPGRTDGGPGSPDEPLDDGGDAPTDTTDVTGGELLTGRPLPDRTQAAAGSPIRPFPLLQAAPAPAPVLGTRTAPGTGPLVLAVPPVGGSAPGGAGDAVVDTPAGGAEGARDQDLAAPPRRVDRRPATMTPELASRVVIPVALLVAGLVYLLLQGRIDHRGTVLTAPKPAGTEHDEDVYEL